jgi:hypothetical protein
VGNQIGDCIEQRKGKLEAYCRARGGRRGYSETCRIASARRSMAAPLFTPALAAFAASARLTNRAGMPRSAAAAAESLRCSIPVSEEPAIQVDKVVDPSPREPTRGVGPVCSPAMISVADAQQVENQNQAQGEAEQPEQNEDHLRSPLQ